jgi:hypothetical protein
MSKTCSTFTSQDTSHDRLGDELDRRPYARRIVARAEHCHSSKRLIARARNPNAGGAPADDEV